jgi:hypothetical protein
MKSKHCIMYYRVSKREKNSKSTDPKNPSIQIQNNILSCEETVKLLGIDIDYQLKFNQHISNLCRKASQQLNVLKRLACGTSKIFLYLK